MPLLAKNKGGQDFDPIKPGMYQAVCYSVIDIGTQPPVGLIRARRQVVITWEIPSQRIDIERDGKKQNLPRACSKTMTLSLSQKSNMRPMLEAWRGRPFTEKELEGFDLQKLLGVNCLINVINKKKDDGKVFAEVATVNPLPAQGFAKLKPENPMTFFSLDDQKGPVTIPPTIPEWIKGKILQSQELNDGEQQHHQEEPTNSEQGNQDEEVPF